VSPEQFSLLLGAIATLIVAITGLLIAVQRWHAQVNARMDQLLLLTAAAARAEGVLEGARPTTGSKATEDPPNI
jgi:hypothetical protein